MRARAVERVPLGKVVVPGALAALLLGSPVRGEAREGAWSDLAISILPRMEMGDPGGPRVVVDLTFVNAGRLPRSLPPSDTQHDCFVRSELFQIFDESGHPIPNRGPRAAPGTRPRSSMLRPGERLTVYGLDITDHYAFPVTRTNLAVRFTISPIVRGKPRTVAASPFSFTYIPVVRAEPDGAGQGVQWDRRGRTGVVHCVPILPGSATPQWVAGRWTGQGGFAHLEARFAGDARAIRGTVTDLTATGRAREFASYEIRQNGRTLALRLRVRREGGRIFEFNQTHCRAPPLAKRVCFEQGPPFQPGADIFEISLEDGRLVTNTGFGPQHGAKVFERYVFVPAAPE
jgi:hypothetical protein